MAAETRIALMKERFYRTLASLRISTNAKNTAFIEDERFKELIEEVSRAKTTTRKTSRDYWLLRRYDVLTIDQNSKLIFPIKETTSTIIYYACDSELFDILHEAHIRICHGGRDRMMKENVETEKDLEKIIQDLTKKEDPQVSACELSKMNTEADVNQVSIDVLDQSETNTQPPNYTLQCSVCSQETTGAHTFREYGCASTLFALLLKNHPMKDLDLKFCVQYIRKRLSTR
ncbi:SCAN domain-containing protein 3 [Danaus plexippus plexippus]|uniref:SCAN domain-containing protein 3 n=1 Tax=Danaus plexippus plexippus TaxID=278856 RepID=A0A212F8I5_DANPL|nr:SCAN domain-containing protein 3 [Danaus plexippus plexippus]